MHREEGRAVIRAVPAIPENQPELVAGAAQRGGDLEILRERRWRRHLMLHSSKRIPK